MAVLELGTLNMAEQSTPSAHLSVRVQSGPHCLLSKIFFAPVNISFAGLFLRVSEQDSRVSEQHVLERVIISDKPGNSGMEVEPGSPISLCEEFNAKYVTFYVSKGGATVQSAQRNAFHVLMSATKDRNHLPASVETEHRQLIATERLHNQVLVYMKSVGAGFTRDLVDSVGVSVVRTLKDALWYIDTAHEQFEDRGIRLPESFKRF